MTASFNLEQTSNIHVKQLKGVDSKWESVRERQVDMFAQ